LMPEQAIPFSGIRWKGSIGLTVQVAHHEKCQYKSQCLFHGKEVKV